jgi:hypothetical protein
LFNWTVPQLGKLMVKILAQFLVFVFSVYGANQNFECNWQKLIKTHDGLQIKLAGNLGGETELAHNFYNEVTRMLQTHGLNLYRPNSFTKDTSQFWLSVILVSYYNVKRMGGFSLYQKNAKVPSEFHSINEVLNAKPQLSSLLLKNDPEFHLQGKLFRRFLADVEINRLIGIFKKAATTVTPQEYNSLFKPETIVKLNLRGRGWNFTVFMLVVLLKGPQFARNLFPSDPSDDLQEFVIVPFKQHYKRMPKLYNTVINIVTDDSLYAKYPDSPFPEIRAALKEVKAEIEFEMKQQNAGNCQTIEGLFDRIKYPAIYSLGGEGLATENLSEMLLEVLGERGIGPVYKYIHTEWPGCKPFNALILSLTVEDYESLNDLKMYLLNRVEDPECKTSYEAVKKELERLKSGEMIKKFRVNFSTLNSKFPLSQYLSCEEKVVDLETFHKQRIEYLERTKVQIMESAIREHFRGNRMDSIVAKFIREDTKAVRMVIDQELKNDYWRLINGFAFFSVSRDFKKIKELQSKQYLTSNDVAYISAAMQEVMPRDLSDLRYSIDSFLEELLDTSRTFAKRFIKSLAHQNLRDGSDRSCQIKQQLQEPEAVFQILRFCPVVTSLLYFGLSEGNYNANDLARFSDSIARLENIDIEFIKVIIAKAQINLRKHQRPENGNYLKLLELLSNPELAANLAGK